MTNLLLTENARSESFYHKAIKRLIFKYISENNRKIVEKSLEKYIFNRRADVYFRLNSGEQVVVEVQSSKISVKEIINRTEHYNKIGIYVLWILYGNGTCVASPKSPEDKNNIKISMVENFLHRMYGGRVYYVSINFHKDKTAISVPFALHFSLSSNKKNHKILRSKYESYYIRNVNFAKIPSWNIFCVNYNGFKLARFYDKSVKRVLKNEIFMFWNKKKKRSCSNCSIKFKNLRKCKTKENCNFKQYKKRAFIKLILIHFNKKYGELIILNSILDLIKEKKIDSDKKYILKKLSFFSCEKKGNF